MLPSRQEMYARLKRRSQEIMRRLTKMAEKDILKRTADYKSGTSEEAILYLLEDCEEEIKRLRKNQQPERASGGHNEAARTKIGEWSNPKWVNSWSRPELPEERGRNE